MSLKLLNIMWMFTVVVLAFLESAYGSTWQQLGSDIDGEATNDNLGAVSLSDNGHIMAVGAYNSGGSGTVSVLQYNTTETKWLKIGNDIQGSFTNGYFGKAVQLSGDGNTVVVGVPQYDNGVNTYMGAVMVYHYTESTGWIQKGNTIEFSIDTLYLAEKHNELSISGDGNILAIGIPRRLIDFDGRVHVYHFNNGNWVLMGTVIHSLEDEDGFGAGVSLSHDGQTLAIGAPYKSINANAHGSLKIYTYFNGDWIPKGNEVYGDTSYNNFGFDVSLSGDGNIVASGATGYDETMFSNKGRVRVFQYTNGNWAPLGSAIVGEAYDDESGKSIELSYDGLTIAIGAPKNNGTNPSHMDAGHVRVYRYENSDWVKIFEDLDGEGHQDYSGENIGLSCNGEIVAIGALYNDNSNGSDAGHVRVFESPNATGSDATCLASFPTPPDEDSDGNSAQSQLGIIIGSVAGGIVVIGGLVYLLMNWPGQGKTDNSAVNLGNLVF